MLGEQLSLNPVVDIFTDKRGNQSATLYYHCQAQVELVEILPAQELQAHLGTDDLMLLVEFKLGARVIIQNQYLILMPIRQLSQFEEYISRQTSLDVYLETRHQSSLALRFMRNFDGQLLKLWQNLHKTRLR